MAKFNKPPEHCIITCVRSGSKAVSSWAFGNKPQQLFYFHPTPQKENSSLMAPSFFIYFFIRQTFHVLLEAQFSMILQGKANNTLSDGLKGNRYRRSASFLWLFDTLRMWCASENPSNCREILEGGQRAASSKDSCSLACSARPQNPISSWLFEHGTLRFVGRLGKTLIIPTKMTTLAALPLVVIIQGRILAWPQRRKNEKNVSFLKDTVCVWRIKFHRKLGGGRC